MSTQFQNANKIKFMPLPYIGMFDLDVIYQSSDAELLYQVLYKLNEIAKSHNIVIDNFKNIVNWAQGQIEKFTNEQLQTWLDDGTFENLININLLSHKLDCGTNVIAVGPGCPYETITSGFNALIAKGGGTLIVYSGVYDEYLNAGIVNVTVNIVGVGDVQWISTTAGYDYAPFTGGGNIGFYNITFVKGVKGYSNTATGGYALHLDYPGATGIMKIINCTLISYENSALGCGTRTNQEIYVDNCRLYSYAPAGKLANNGALLYHTAPESNHTGQLFTLISNYCYSVNGPGISILNSGNNTERVTLTLINNISVSEFYTLETSNNYFEQGTVLSDPGENNKFIITPQKCYGNNSDKLNYFSDSPLNNRVRRYDGTGVDYSTTLTGCQFINIPSTETDVPTPNHTYVGILCLYGTNTQTDFGFMLIMDINNGQWYRRRKNNGVWSSYTAITWN